MEIRFLHPVTGEHLQLYLEAVVNDLVRMAGSVLSSKFRTATQPLIEGALNRLHGS